MNLKKQYLLILTALVFSFVSTSSYAQNLVREPIQGAIGIGSEALELTSAINGIRYKFLISLPASYGTDPSKTYPVCYVLDGQWSFSSVVSSYWDMHWDGMLPEIIIVGLTYAGKDPDYDSLRSHDYSPTKIPQFPAGGGAEEYVEILRKEVIPFIDKAYRTNKVDRSLTGTSLGGLFTHYVLFNAPELFNGYIPINPSLWWDNGLPFVYEEAFSQKNKPLNARVCMISGEFDAVENFNKMVQQIQSRQYKGLSLESRILEGMGHSGSKAEGHARGLKYVYERQAVKLPDSELEQYTGSYQVMPGLEVQIVANDGELKITGFPGSPDIRLFAVNDKEFSLMGSYHDFSFLRDEQGKVTGIRVEQSGGRIDEVKKVK